MLMQKPFPLRYLFFIGCTVTLMIVGYFHREVLWRQMQYYYTLFSDRDLIKSFISSFGYGAPVVFILIQILQVMLAPIPGEVTGFIGGYLFGIIRGFLYSSVALALGSWINFGLARYLGKPLVRKLIPAGKLERFDAVLKRQGILVVMVLFVFPGFPKDYLCYFLGLSAFPWKVFLVIASIGRLPGTLMLSLQGSFLYERSYGPLAVVAGLSLLLAYLGYRYRERIYRWAERLNNG